MFSPGSPARMLSGVPLSVLLLAILLPNASAQALPSGVEFHEGGHPGVRVYVDGVDVSYASRPLDALVVDPVRAANLSVSLSPPPGETWRLSGMRSSLALGGPARADLAQFAAVEATIPDGYTGYLNRTLDLQPLEDLGAGVFLMRATVLDASGEPLAEKEFYVRLAGIPVLTAQGAVVAALSVGAGYGLWRLARDVVALRWTFKRHREGTPAAALVGTDPAAGRAIDLARTFGGAAAARWAMTGIGLGTVALSWAQFYGLVAFDMTQLLVTATATGGAFLAGPLVLRRMLQQAAGPTRTLVPEAPPPAPELADPPRQR